MEIAMNEEMTDKVMVVLSKYADFSGRARRAEYWYWILFINILSIVISILSPHNSILVFLLLLVPNLAISFRRIHDLDKSGWWLMIGLIPLVGACILLYWFVQRGTIGPNQYGPDPLQEGPVQSAPTQDAPMQNEAGLDETAGAVNEKIEPVYNAPAHDEFAQDESVYDASIEDEHDGSDPLQK
jgi:uncharacterized membrane protein YhaH (DUF805 family)